MTKDFDSLHPGIVRAPRGTLRVHVATTRDTRSRGLSNREHVPQDGLVLLWSEPGTYPIWMHGMRFALDLVWFGAGGAVLAVLPEIPPCAAPPCPTYTPPKSGGAVGVLEIPAGAAERYGIDVGVTLSIDCPSAGIAI